MGPGAHDDGELAPLCGEEERAWRSLARAFTVVPRVLEAEIHAAHGVTMTEYFVLVHLSEAPDRRLRMSELAERGAMSLSAISRVVDALGRRGLVERERCASDGRGLLAILTDAGLACLEEVYPTHLRGVREHVIGHLAGLDLDRLATSFEKFAGGERDAAGPR
ncbi:MAG: MarR family winged helix-turn-helix transcriptional regulator [Acidimicrobiales bacterium]